MMNKRVVVGMSGGVDSSYAAYLLKKQGYEVIGVTFKLQNTPNHLERIEAARQVATILSIPHYVKDIVEEFKKEVIDYFCKEYILGRTPNACVVCNEQIKFKYLLLSAKEINCEHIATGHYARIAYDEPLGAYFLKKGKDRTKDQSYFLYRLNQDILKRVIFPLAEYTKQEAIRWARSIKLPLNYYESQDICFLQNKDYKTFLLERYKDRIKEGPIIDKQRKIVGRHKGLPFYTVGQRKGLKIALGYKAYVIDKDIEHNAIMVGELSDCYKDLVKASFCNFVLTPKLETSLKAKVRYRGGETEAKLEKIDDNRIIVKFKEGVFAPTPGQSIVFYHQDTLIGGGIIE